MQNKRAVGGYFLLGAILFLVAVIYFLLIGYNSGFQKSLTGFQVQGGGSSANIGDPEPSDQVDGDSGSGSSSGSSQDFSFLSPSQSSVGFEDVGGFGVSLRGSGVSDNNPIIIRKPKVEQTIVANDLVTFSSSIDVPSDVDGEISVDLPQGSRFVRVSGGDSQVSISTKRFFGDLFDGFSIGAGSSEEVIKITNPKSGDYDILFTTNTPYVSQIQTIRGGSLRVTVNNPSQIDYSGVNIYTEVTPEYLNGRFEVVSSKGKEKFADNYDSNEDGSIDIVKFESDLPAGSKEVFVVREVEFGTKEIAVSEFGSQSGDVSLSPTIPTSLSEECEQALAELESSECEFEIASDEVLRGELSGAVRKTYYTFSNSNCPTDFVRSEYCSLEKGQNVKVVPAPVSESPSGTEIGIITRRSIELVDSETQNIVASLSYDPVREKLDISF